MAFQPWNLLLAFAVLLAGCTDDAPAADLPASEDQETEPATALATTPPGASSAVPTNLTAVCKITRTNVGTTTGFGLNIDRVVTGIEECHLDDLLGNTTWANALLVEATWTNQPTQTGTDLYLESMACQPTIPPTLCDPPQTMGATSPLRLEVTADQLRAVEGHDPQVSVSGQGVVKDLAYTLYITLFAGDLPPGYTAIPA